VSGRLGGSLKCLNATCRDAARLITQQDERPLSAAERAGLFIHLMICRPCRRYRRGVIFLRKVMRRAAESGGLPADAGLPNDARERIRQNIAGR